MAEQMIAEPVAPPAAEPASGFAFAGGRLRSIDALRGLAAIGVVLFHARQAAGDPISWLDRLAYGAVFFGRYGVWLFFVISGFCIHMRWAKQRQTDPEARIEFVSFWKRRFRRLYPPFLAAFILYIALLHREGLAWTGTTLWRMGLNLFMLGNLDPGALNAINGVFWTLAIEEQLYLAYFVLLALRVRFGWRAALTVAIAARAVWYAMAMVLHRAAGLDILVTQAVASQWSIWALGAVAVEAALGLVRLPAWTRNGWIGTGVLAAAALNTCAYAFWITGTPAGDVCWLIGDLVWGLGFFIWVNCAVAVERRWNLANHVPRMAAWCASLGVFSYSLYLTHQLLVEHLWPMAVKRLPALSGLPPVAGMLSLAGLSVLFAWGFFIVFERPFLSGSRRSAKAATSRVSEPVAG